MPISVYFWNKFYEPDHEATKPHLLYTRSTIINISSNKAVIITSCMQTGEPGVQVRETQKRTEGKLCE